MHSQDEQTLASACASAATWAPPEPDTPIPFQSHRGEAAVTSGVLHLSPGCVIRCAVSCWQHPLPWVRHSVSPSSPGVSPGCPSLTGDRDPSPCGRADLGGQHPLEGEGRGMEPAEGGAGSPCPAKRTNYSCTVHPCLQWRVILATMTATSPGPRELYKSEQNKSAFAGSWACALLPFQRGGTFLYRSAFPEDCHSDSTEIKQNNPLNLPFSSISPWVEQTTGQGHHSHLLLLPVVV